MGIRNLHEFLERIETYIGGLTFSEKKLLKNFTESAFSTPSMYLKETVEHIKRKPQYLLDMWVGLDKDYSEKRISGEQLIKELRMLGLSPEKMSSRIDDFNASMAVQDAVREFGKERMIRVITNGKTIENIKPKTETGEIVGKE